MDLREAREILGLSTSSTPEEIKKRYRELVKSNHPDVGGELATIKRINEAYDLISGKTSPKEEIGFQQNPFNGNPFGFGHPFRQTVRHAENITLNTTISFREAVLGCKRDIKFSRKVKCSKCDGNGKQQINNGCDKCQGRGQSVRQQGNMIFTMTCDKCQGKQQLISCNDCSSSGVLDASVSIDVTIPPGILDTNILRLSNMGNFVGGFMGMEQYTDAHLHVSVTPEEGLSLVGTDVVSTITIDLLEAVLGSNKTVNTIDGDKTITIPKLSKNKEEVILPNLGVAEKGSHRVILDVTYPDNIEKILSEDIYGV